MIIDNLIEIPAVPTPALGLLPAIHDAVIEPLSPINGAFLLKDLSSAINKGSLATSLVTNGELVITAKTAGVLSINVSCSRSDVVNITSVQDGAAAIEGVSPVPAVVQISKIGLLKKIVRGDQFQVFIGEDTYSVTVGTPRLPIAGEVKGSVFINDMDSAVVLPATEKWPARDLGIGEVFGSDGRLFYQVTNKQGTTSYYPSHFERMIYTFSFSPKTFPLGSIFDFERYFYFRLIGNNTTAVWSVIFEVGERVYQTTPSLAYQITVNLTSQSKEVVVPSSEISKLSYLMLVSGDGVPSGGLDGDTYIESISGNKIKLTRPATYTGSKLINFSIPVGPNLAEWKWRPPLLEQEIVMTDMKSMNNLGIWIKNWGEKKRLFPDGSFNDDPYRNDYGYEGYAKLFSQSYPVRPESLPTTSEFLIRLRIGQFDTENTVSNPSGYAAYVIRATQEDQGEADSA